MNCEQTQLLLHPYLDGELDVVQSLDVVEHLRQCAACEESRARVQGLSRLIARSELRLTAPPALKERVQSALSRIERPASLEGQRRRWFALAVAVAMVLAALAIPIGRSGWFGSSSNDLLAQEVTAAHVRSLLVDHLVDVASSNRHTVKPWFNGKLDFATPAVDLSDRDFELVGGRLDVLEIHPVAAFVYRRRQHVINVFMWPTSPIANSLIGEQASRGFNLLHWSGAGRICWVISDLNSKELHDFAVLFRERAEQSAGG
jgi:anti-sigma factor RsiW